MKNSRIHLLVSIFFIVGLHLSAQNTCTLYASDFITTNNGDHTLTLKSAIQEAFKGGCTLIIDSPNKNNPENWVIKEVFIEGEKLTQVPGAKIIFKAPIKALSSFFIFENGLRDAPPSLFVFEECDNFQILGEGNATISMKGLNNQSGLQHYTRTSEWYHGFKMLSCDNVLMEGLIIDGTGGDGIYIDAKRYHNGQLLCNIKGHYPKNFIVKRCYVNSSFRNGIAIGSGENILIEECTISNTKGVAPQVGIDIEIESCGAYLKNLVVKNNTFIDNWAYGIACSFSTVEAKNELNVKFIGNEILGSKGYAFDTRNKNYLTGKVQVSSSTIDITDPTNVAPLGFLIAAPKPSTTGNNLIYDIGDDVVIYNSSANNNFIGLRVKAKELRLFSCKESNPCRKEVEHNWIFFGDVVAEKVHIWDNHGSGKRTNKCVQISRGGMDCVNPKNIKIQAIKRNTECQCGKTFNLRSSFFSEDNCNICSSGPENRDQQCLDVNSSPNSRFYHAKSVDCNVDVSIETVRNESNYSPIVSFSHQSFSIDEDGFINIFVQRQKVENYPLSVKLDWNKSLLQLRKYFYQFPQFIQIPANQTFGFRKIKVRAEAPINQLNQINLRFAKTEFYRTSKQILEFRENLGIINTPQINNTNTESFTDSINYSQTCLPNGITFKSQFQLDSFRVLYPNCTEILGHVEIRYDNENPIQHFYGLLNVKKVGAMYFDFGIYQNLSGLENLEEISESLIFHNSDSLLTLEGLSNLKSTGSLVINNLNIHNFAGLENLETIKHNLSIYDNQSLTSLKGLDNVRQIGFLTKTGFLNNILISKNPKLQNLDALENLNPQTALIKGNLRIIENPSLIDLRGLKHISSVENLVEIKENSSLINLFGLDNLLKVNRLIINGNSNLLSLSGLRNLRIINYGLEISNNDKLHDLESFNELRNLGMNLNSEQTPFLNISSNASLISLLPLKNLFQAQPNFSGIISLKDNPRVLNLLGLEDLKSTIDLEVSNLGIKDFFEMKQLQEVSRTLAITRNYSLLSMNGLDNLSILGYQSNSNTPSLVIQDNARLKSLQELKNVRATGALFKGSLLIVGNDSLKNLTGLDGLDSIGWDLKINNNSNLENLEGLNNLVYVLANKDISNNPKLKNLDALSNFRISYPGTTFFEIRNNPSLESLHGLRNYKFSKVAVLRFFNNPLISICHYPEICEFADNNTDEKYYDIFGNGKNCEFIDDIRWSCVFSEQNHKINHNKKTIKIHPNPTSGKLNISGVNSNNMKITIFNPSGKIVSTEILNEAYSIDLPKHIQGLLFVKIETENLVETHKIFKH